MYFAGMLIMTTKARLASPFEDISKLPPEPEVEFKLSLEEGGYFVTIRGPHGEAFTMRLSTLLAVGDGFAKESGG